MKQTSKLFECFSFSQVAGNKIRLAARLGVPLAANWITNEDGKVIEEELENVPDKFFMTPMGGNRENSSHKGITFFLYKNGLELLNLHKIEH